MKSPLIGPVRWYWVLPAAFMMYTIAFFDRVNLGIALPFITQDLHLSPAQAGWVGGAFAWGYAVTQLLAGWFVLKTCARNVIIMSLFLFGAAAMSIALATSFEYLIISRLLLGLAEGPLYAATCRFLSQWFVKSERGRAFGIWNMSIGFGAVLAGPISGLLLAHGSWQTMMMVEGLPAWIFALLWLWKVPKDLASAKFVTDADREVLLRQLEEEHEAHEEALHDPWWTVLGDRRVWMMALGYSLNNVMLYGFTLWLPTALHNIGSISITMIGVFSGLPFVATMLGIFYITRRSDKHGQERRLHAAVPTLVTGLMMILAAFIPTQLYLLQIAMFVMVGFTMKMLVPLIFARVTEILPPRQAVPAVALISGVGNLVGQFAGPLVIGYIQMSTQDFAISWATAGCFSLCGGISILLSRHPGNGRQIVAQTGIDSERNADQLMPRNSIK